MSRTKSNCCCEKIFDMRIGGGGCAVGVLGLVRYAVLIPGWVWLGELAGNCWDFRSDSDQEICYFRLDGTPLVRPPLDIY